MTQATWLRKHHERLTLQDSKKAQLKYGHQRTAERTSGLACGSDQQHLYQERMWYHTSWLVLPCKFMVNHMMLAHRGRSR